MQIDLNGRTAIVMGSTAGIDRVRLAQVLSDAELKRVRAPICPPRADGVVLFVHDVAAARAAVTAAQLFPEDAIREMHQLN